MAPFSVTVQNVPDRELGPLLTQLSAAGFDNPIIRAVGADGTAARTAAPAGGRPADLPEDWRLVRERDGESHRWPKRRDHYAPYRVFMGTTRAEGAVQIGLGETIRKNAWGRDRKYVVAFLSSGAPQEPLVEFVAADDYEQTRELVAVIRGSDGGRRMYGAGDGPSRGLHRTLPNSDLQRADHLPERWNKLVVVAREDEDDAMLNHALIQSRRRYRT